MNNIKSTKGITLVALVITIIILLILAGVTMGALMGDNGLIQRAQDAKIVTKKKYILKYQENKQKIKEKYQMTVQKKYY